MKRKIIKQGHNTLTLTLPSIWTKRLNLKAGDEIDLIEKEDNLIINCKKNPEKLRTEINITGLDIPTIWKYFMAVYREGYDEVKIIFDSYELLESPYRFLTQHRLDLRKKQKEKMTMLGVLQGFVDRFIGFEIVEHGKGFVLIKDMGDPTFREFDNSLRRVFLLIQQMAEETVQAIDESDPSILSYTHDIDINLDKFHDYCIRILNKIGNKGSKKESLLFAMLYLLELTGDEFKNISTHIIYDYPKTKLGNLKKLTEYIKEQINTYYELFYGFDIEKIKRMTDIDKELYLSVPQLYKKATEEEKEVYHHLRMISRYINALIELRIEMEF